MFRFLTVREQLVIERKKNEQLQAKLLKNRSDTDYIAMMTDIDLDEDEPEENEEMEEDEDEEE